MSDVKPILSDFQEAGRRLVPKGDILVWLTSLPKAPTAAIEAGIVQQVRDLVEDQHFVPADHRQALSNAIHNAIRHDRPEMLPTLIKAAKIASPENWQIPQGHDSYSYLARCLVRKPRIECMKTLLDEKFNPNMLGAEDRSALTLALYRFMIVHPEHYGTHEQAVQAAHILLDAKADPTLKYGGWSGLNLVLQTGNFELIAKSRAVALDLHPEMKLPKIPRWAQPTV